MNNTLIILRGPLGVGKTTVAEKIAYQLGGKRFSIDEVLAEYNLDDIGEQHACIPLPNFLKANEAIIPQAKEIIAAGQPVIIEGNFYFKEAVEDLLKKIPSKQKVFTLKASLETCIERDTKRKNSRGQLAAAAVCNLVKEFDYGTIIDTEKKSLAKVVGEIIKEIK